jgi:hypothetical protein
LNRTPLWRRMRSPCRNFPPRPWRAPSIPPGSPPTLHFCDERVVSAGIDDDKAQAFGWRASRSMSGRPWWSWAPAYGLAPEPHVPPSREFAFSFSSALIRNLPMQRCGRTLRSLGYCLNNVARAGTTRFRLVHTAGLRRRAGLVGSRTKENRAKRLCAICFRRPWLPPRRMRERTVSAMPNRFSPDFATSRARTVD